MKIFNYSDTPVIINGVSITDHLIHLDNGIPKSHVTHNGVRFLGDFQTDRNIIYTITNDSGGGYIFRSDVLEVPNIYPWVGLYITFFGFWLMIKIVQKIKTR